MGNVEKHYRISQAAYQAICGRDQEQYPKERDYVNAAIQTFEDRQRFEEIMERLDQMEEKLEQLLSANRYR